MRYNSTTFCFAEVGPAQANAVPSHIVALLYAVPELPEVIYNDLSVMLLNEGTVKDVRAVLTRRFCAAERKDFTPLKNKNKQVFTLEKIKLDLPVIVEGKYDKNALLSVCDATVITTDGFGIFKNEERRALIRRLSERGVIILCDSDGAGKLIRAHLSGLVPREKIYQLYVPQIEGKERRKRKPSAEGFLGVEGVGTEILRECVLRLVERNPEIISQSGSAREDITPSDMYFAGLSGGERASEMRDAISERLGLPRGLGAKSLLCAMNMIIDKNEFLRLTDEVK